MNKQTSMVHRRRTFIMNFVHTKNKIKSFVTQKKKKMMGLFENYKNCPYSMSQASISSHNPTPQSLIPKHNTHSLSLFVL